MHRFLEELINEIMKGERNIFLEKALTTKAMVTIQGN